MTEQAQFIAFVESLRTESNAETLDIILEGYGACMEAGLLKKIGKAALPIAAAAGIMAGGGLDDSDLYDIEKQNAEQMRYSNSDLSNIVKEHEAAIKSGDEKARAVAYDKVKQAGMRVGYDPEANLKFYWDTNLGRAFYPDGREVPAEERQYLPAFN